jgi:hypothetical protein
LRLNVAIILKKLDGNARPGFIFQLSQADPAGAIVDLFGGTVGTQLRR